MPKSVRKTCETVFIDQTTRNSNQINIKRDEQTALRKKATSEHPCVSDRWNGLNPLQMPRIYYVIEMSFRRHKAQNVQRSLFNFKYQASHAPHERHI